MVVGADSMSHSEDFIVGQGILPSVRVRSLWVLTLDRVTIGWTRCDGATIGRIGEEQVEEDEDSGEDDSRDWDEECWTECAIGCGLEVCGPKVGNWVSIIEGEVGLMRDKKVGSCEGKMREGGPVKSGLMSWEGWVGADTTRVDWDWKGNWASLKRTSLEM